MAVLFLLVEIIKFNSKYYFNMCLLKKYFCYFLDNEKNRLLTSSNKMHPLKIGYISFGAIFLRQGSFNAIVGLRLALYSR